MLMSVQDSLRSLPQFSATLLKITKKLSGLDYLKFLPLQYRIHAAIELLLEARGEVRLVLVKPRQIRASTYFQAFTFKQMYDIEGTQALTITHRAAVTDELFATMKRFQDYMPEDLKIHAKKDNDEVLYLANESKAKVATAGSDAARGFPCRILQPSELGRYTGRQEKDVQEGAFQTLATGHGSFCFVESTSGGSGNWFADLAEEGRDPHERWKTLFFGFHEEPEYRLMPPHNFEPTEEERELAREFKLDIFQLAWRRSKLKSEFRGSETAFNREYPLTFEMAFAEAGGKLLDYLALVRARTNILVIDPYQPVIMGVDPAGKGGDRTVIVIRQGNAIIWHKVWPTMDDAALTQIINDLMNRWDVNTCFVDMGYGHGTVSHLRAMGRYNVIGVWFNGTSREPGLYRNMRTQMAADFRDWMHQGPEDRGGLVKIPADKEFFDDLKAVPDLQFSSNKSVFFLPPKEKIKEELGKSTDIFDACCLTFAYPVKSAFQRKAMAQQVPTQEESILVTSREFAQLQADNFSAKLNSNPNFRYYSFGS